MKHDRHFLKKIPSVYLIWISVGLMTGCVDLPTGPDERAAYHLDRTAMHSRDNSLHDQGMGSHYSESYISVDQGGVLDFFNGTLAVAPGSIGENTTIWARIYRLNRHGFFKRIYHFGPSGITFDPDAVLTLSYGELGPLMPNSLDLKVFNEATGVWEVASHMVNHPESKSFVGPIQHFSRYSLSGNGQTLAPEIEEN